MRFTRDLFEALRLTPQSLDGCIIVCRLMMVENEVLRPRQLAQFDASYIVRVSPILLDRYRIGERVHGVENDQVGVAEKIDETLRFVHIVELMFRIGRIDQDLVAAFEAVAIGIAPMRL